MNLMTDSALARKEKEQNDQQWVRKHLSQFIRLSVVCNI
jgi:hypothetical protein